MAYDDSTDSVVDEVAEKPPASDQDKFRRLIKSLGCSRKKMKVFRDHRLEVIKQMVGIHYGEKSGAPPAQVPLNLIDLEQSTMTRLLAGRLPKVMVAVDHQILKPTAESMRLALNRLMDLIKLNKTFKRVAGSAYIGIGMVKVGMSDVTDQAFAGQAVQPFVDNVDLDNLVFDMTATKTEEFQFIGDRYRMTVESVKNNENFDENIRSKVKAWDGDDDGFDDETDGDSASDVSTGTSKTEGESYEDVVELWDIYLFRENKVMTICPCIKEGPLRVVDWEGPQGGPYRALFFKEVPNNVFPLPPIANSIDLHDATNALLRKAINQAEREKIVTLYKEGAEKDAEKIRDASDGEIISTADPNNIGEAKFGGISSATPALIMQFQNMYSYRANNLDTVGGLSSETDTVGQERLLDANASKAVREMQDRMMEFASEVIHMLAWYLFYDPLIKIPITKRLPKSDLEVPAWFTPEDRNGDFLDYNFHIQPYSMSDTTPEQKFQATMELLQTVILPLGPAIQQQGGMIDVQELLKQFADYLNLDGLKDIVKFQMDPNQGQPIGTPPQKMQPEAPAMPAVTTRRYVRENRPGASRQGQAQVMAQLAAGGNPQQAEKASLMRKT
ncbi:MAG: hypothetical protein WC100_03415 [Sterolibacterium sp.]